MSTATITDQSVETSGESNRLTETLKERLSHPETSPDFDLKKGVNEVLADVGMTSDDCGGELSFYGSDPILQSPLRFGTMAAIGLAARSVAVAALWRQATGEGQNISVDVRKALRRFCGFFDGKWETRCSFARHATDDTWWRWTFILNCSCVPLIFSAAAQAPNPLTRPYSIGTLWN
jgi:hypothetical protein